VTRTTYHLVPEEVWATTDPGHPYAAPSLWSEGFIHCTDGATHLIATANRHFVGDLRPFLVLTIDLDSVDSPWRIDDPARIYPHVFGPIDPSAIVAIARMDRASDGRFQRIGLSLDRT
jgi:uncharacterized protein (DUF952 family)